jgi:hypothetical protein
VGGGCKFGMKKFLGNQLRTMSKFAYPTVRRDESHIDVLHGLSVKDPYRHLEDPDAQETQAFVSAQNDLFQGFIKQKGYRDRLRDKLTDMFNYERFVHIGFKLRRSLIEQRFGFKDMVALLKPAIITISFTTQGFRRRPFSTNRPPWTLLRQLFLIQTLSPQTER